MEIFASKRAKEASQT